MAISLLLARGRDRLETVAFMLRFLQSCFDLLLARGRDRLETAYLRVSLAGLSISYSLGDAIDWKPTGGRTVTWNDHLSYSLGDAIDWKLKTRKQKTLS